ncbi:MAG: FHA domain-containing protein [Acidobacteria bacterium]|nr:FHA domain-containing protein [Acidobacteriota bacterium]
MLEVTLTYPTPEGSREIRIDDGRTTFGRGSEAVYRFADDGLSRLHATVYREGDRVWIVDENSSNGTFVNGERAAPAGTPLRNGDTVRIGHQTNLHVWIAEKAEAKPAPTAYAPAQSAAAQPISSGPAGISVLPVALIAGAILIVSLSAVVIGYTVLGKSRTEVVQSTNEDYDADEDRPVKDTKPSPTPKSGSTTRNADVDAGPVPNGSPAQTNGAAPPPDLLKGRTYLQLSDAEKRQYLSVNAMKIAQIIGNNSSDPIPPAALDKIKAFTDAYAKRINVKPLGGCRFGDNLQATYERASKNAPFIVKAFNEKGTDPRIGLYLAMIESEHCVCLQSPTGPLGMFQFTYATAKLHFEPSDGVLKGASDTNPDIRCQPEPAARAAASYMKALTGRYGTGPAGVPLAIGSYNSGEGGLSSNLVKALESNSGLPRDFWTLIANGDKLSKQFQAENFKYVPKFFAAAIIGENPQDFGLKLQPLSTYSK